MVVSDIKFALRALRKNLTFTVTAVATLALGIGANSAIFTLVNSVLLQSLPYPDADHVVSIGREGGVPEPLFAFWALNNAGFKDLTATSQQMSLNLNTGERAEVILALVASQSYFRLFGGQSNHGTLL